MKKIILLLLVICLIFITSCNDKTPETKIQLDIIESTIKDVYYIDEFNITTIKMNVTKNEETKEEALTPLLIENYPSEFEEGQYTFKVNYEGVKTEFNVNFIEREYYTEGLEFVLNKTEDAYLVSNYKGTEENVIIPSTFNYLNVVGIKSYAFNKNQTIKKVTLPNTISEIEANAFVNSSIKEINIPESVKKIGAAAFYFCDNLRSVTIPKSVKTIEEYALYNTILVYTDIDDTNSWNKDAFDDNLVYIHKGLDLSKIVRENNFEFYVDETVSLLNYLGNDSIVEIPSEFNSKPIVEISNSAFLKNQTLEEVTISNNIKVIKDKAFRETALNSVEIPSSVKEIGVYAFSACESLKSVIFNEGLEIINISAFAACNNLLSAILPSSLKRIEQYGFQNCLSIKTIYIPKNVDYIGEGAFYACGRSTLYIEAASIPSSWHANFSPSGAKKVFNAHKDNLS